MAFLVLLRGFFMAFSFAPGRRLAEGFLAATAPPARPSRSMGAGRWEGVSETSALSPDLQRGGRDARTVEASPSAAAKAAGLPVPVLFRGQSVRGARRVSGQGRDVSSPLGARPAVGCAGFAVARGVGVAVPSLALFFRTRGSSGAAVGLALFPAVGTLEGAGFWRETGSVAERAGIPASEALPDRPPRRAGSPGQGGDASLWGSRGQSPLPEQCAGVSQGAGRVRRKSSEGAPGRSGCGWACGLAVRVLGRGREAGGERRLSRNPDEGVPKRA